MPLLPTLFEGLYKSTAGTVLLGTGPIPKHITVGTGLSLIGDVLSATGGGGGGTIGGSTGSTDNALIRADGTGGSTVQSSSVIVDDSGNLSSGGTEAGAAFYFERPSWAVGKLKSTGADALFQIQRASNGNSGWIQFQTPGWTSEWRAGLAWSGLISGGDTFAISYFDGTERAFFQLDGDGRVKTRPRGTGTVTALDITAANADYMQFVLGKDSTHQLQAEWDSVNNQGIFSSYNNSYPILVRGSELRFNTASNDRLTINNSGALRLHAYGAGTLVTDSSGNVTAASASTLRTNLGLATGDSPTFAALKIDTTSTGYRLEIGTTASTGTALRIGPANTDAGGFLCSAVNNNLTLLSGAISTTSYIAKATDCSQIHLGGGNVEFFIDTGLTVGASFTPTLRAYVTETAFLPGSTGAVDLGDSTHFWRNMYGRQGYIGEGGTGSTNGSLVLNGSSASDYGASMTFQRNSVTKGAVGTASSILGGTSDDLLIFSNAGVRLYTSGNVVGTGLIVANSSGQLSAITTPSSSSATTTHKLPVNLNGTTFYILLSNV